MTIILQAGRISLRSESYILPTAEQPCLPNGNRDGWCGWVSSGTKAEQAVLHGTVPHVLCSVSLYRLDIDFWNYNLILTKLKIWLVISIIKYEAIICERRAGERKLPFSVVEWLQLSFKLLSSVASRGKECRQFIKHFLLCSCLVSEAGRCS